MDIARDYFWVGMFFVFLQVLAVVRNLMTDFVNFFWFCDFIPGVLAVAFFLKRREVVEGVVNVGLFSQVIYLADVLVRIFTGFSFFRGSDLPFDYGFFVILLSVAFHLASVMAFLVVFRERPLRRSLGFSFGLLTLICLVVVLFADPLDNVNYVYGIFGFEWLAGFWVLIAFFVVVVPTYWFRVFVWRGFGDK